MRSAWLVRLTLVVVALALMAQDDSSCAGETEDQPAQEAPDSGDGQESEAAPDADGSFNLNCDYLLGDFTEGSESGYKFVAGGTVENAGNIGIVARVRVRWQQLGAEPIVEERTVRLRVGGRKRVNITRLATQNEIDAHQSANGDCSPNVKIVDTFGRIRE